MCADNQASVAALREGMTDERTDAVLSEAVSAGIDMTDQATDFILSLASTSTAGSEREKRLEAALEECADAIDFHDRVKTASEAERIAVGQDHWNRLEAAIRAVAKFASPACAAEDLA